MSKNFKNNDPNSKLLPPKKNNADSNNEPKSAADDTEKNPTPKAPKQEKKKPDYLRLDVTDYKDYISLMAEVAKKHKLDEYTATAQCIHLILK